MAMRMNDMGLIQNGFKNVAQYKTFERVGTHWDGKGMYVVWTYDCWKNPETGECVIRVTNNRRFHWLHFFKDRNEANDHIRRAIERFVETHKGDRCANWKRVF